MAQRNTQLRTSSTSSYISLPSINTPIHGHIAFSFQSWKRVRSWALKTEKYVDAAGWDPNTKLPYLWFMTVAQTILKILFTFLRLINRKISIVYMTKILSWKIWNWSIIKHQSYFCHWLYRKRSIIFLYWSIVFLTLTTKYVPLLSPETICTAFQVRHEVSVWPIISCEPVSLEILRTDSKLLVKINWF